MMTQSFAQQQQEFVRDGYTVARGMFAAHEVAAMLDHYMQMNIEHSHKGDVSAITEESDPLKRYPRLLQMHRWDEVSLQFLLDERIRVCMTEILGSEPYAVQTMIYYKPPTARGQALHQDQYYLRVEPGTCCAAWLALDDCDEENGCLQVVPGSQALPVLCTVAADTAQSFTDVTVPVPAEMNVVPVRMRAGDVLFFNGQLIHGSYPNTSSQRFRRSLIGHYVVGEAEKVYKWYHPALRFDGSVVTLGESQDGSECGVWVEQDGTPVVEMIGKTKAVGIAQ
jgi:ectoine hydroxylase-related dioxygenase (phytanoyl-CoA dioxygenase family)